ncbi:fasciclin domain-containing protein [Altericroceibacterium xinjiangense]|uniref:fasciclin domain-containing protein n=1 Tax=Altericroceibacterium xinjiangense TaxID=762261 RepID=UPI000F7EFB02|nr:fasciclin domain-containing protein [Altericroceibacterium xinjiangense]
MQAGRTALRLATLLGAVALGGLGGCSDNDDESTIEKPVMAVVHSRETLAAEIAEAPQLQVLSDVLDDTGLMQLFNGVGSYTIFAPEDAVFVRLADQGTWLREPEQRPLIAAVLRDHIVPGYLTPDDIEAALVDKDMVEIQTMGDRTLRFTRDPSGILISTENGSVVRISGAAKQGSNGVAIPVTGLLKTVPPVS